MPRLDACRHQYGGIHDVVPTGPWMERIRWTAIYHAAPRDILHCSRLNSSRSSTLPPKDDCRLEQTFPDAIEAPRHGADVGWPLVS
jgi:hypothetical protein